MRFKRSGEEKRREKRGVAQLVARSVRDAEVVGSIPVASTKMGLGFNFRTLYLDFSKAKPLFFVEK